MVEINKFCDSTIEKDYMTLTEVLKQLPGIMPQKARKVIARACLNYNDYCENYKDGYNLDEAEYKKNMLTIGSSKLTPEECAEIWVETYYTFHTANELGDAYTIRVSPIGAAVLLKLFLNGDLPEKQKVAASIFPELHNYIAREQEFKDKLEKSLMQKERRDFLLAHPDEVKEADFSFSLLNDLFFRHKGPCHLQGQMMLLDGIEVYKSLCVYRSNSGKSRDFEVTISWTGSDGVAHNVGTASMYNGNRRNDADRNWGLPE